MWGWWWRVKMESKRKQDCLLEILLINARRPGTSHCQGPCTSESLNIWFCITFLSFLTTMFHPIEDLIISISYERRRLGEVWRFLVYSVLESPVHLPWSTRVTTKAHWVFPAISGSMHQSLCGHRSNLKFRVLYFVSRMQLLGLLSWHWVNYS